MVAHVRPEYPSDWPAICAVAEKLGIGIAETLRKRVRQAEVDAGTADGPRNRSLSRQKPVTQDRVTGFDMRKRVAGVGFEPT
jgi:transposase